MRKARQFERILFRGVMTPSLVSVGPGFRLMLVDLPVSVSLSLALSHNAGETAVTCEFHASRTFSEGTCTNIDKWRLVTYQYAEHSGETEIRIHKFFSQDTSEDV